MHVCITTRFPRKLQSFCLLVSFSTAYLAYHPVFTFISHIKSKSKYLINANKSIEMAVRTESCTSNMNMLRSIPSTPPLSTNHIVIMDWDDTLMPSTYLMSNIGYKVDAQTKRVSEIWLKPGSTGKEHEIRAALKESGTAALYLLRTLYLHFVDNASGQKLLIVTNGEQKWFWTSLIIAGALCPIYRQIELFLKAHRTEIIFARNPNLQHKYWKMVSFDWILHQNLVEQQCDRVNVITVGDQWTDHCSIEMASTFRRHPNAVSHHQIKFRSNVNARYIASELRYIASLFVPDNSSKSVLLRFAINHDDAIKLQFDVKSRDKSESPDSPMSSVSSCSTVSSNSSGCSGNTDGLSNCFYSQIAISR